MLHRLVGLGFQPNLSLQLSFLVSEIDRQPLTSFLANRTREYLHNWQMVQNCCYAVLFLKQYLFNLILGNLMFLFLSV